MCFPLILAIIALLCLTWGNKRAPKIWLGSPRTTRTDRPYLWEHEVSKKNRPIASRIGISAKTPFLFLLEKERFTHRITKALGFCKEFQTENPEFDSRAYILSDDATFQSKLQSSAQIQTLVMAAFASGVRDIRATPTHLIARLEKPVATPPDTIDPILDALQALKASLENAIPQSQNKKNLQDGIGHFFHRLPAALLTIAFVNLTTNLIMGYQVVRWGNLWPMTLQVAACFFLAGFAVIVAIFRQSSKGHAILMEYCRITSWSAVLCAVTSLWFTNCYYDTSAPLIHDEPVRDTYANHSRKSTTYHLHVQDWAGGGILSLKISKPLYDRLSPGDAIRVTSRAGTLGMEWITKVEKKE